MTGPAHQILDELSRRIAGMLRVGLVHEVDYVTPRLRVQSGTAADGADWLTGWLPWPAHLGRNRVDWMPLVVGQAVLLACPSGDLGSAIVVALLHVASDPPPSTDETLDVVRFRSGSTVQHDADTGDLVVTGARHVRVTAQGDISADAQGVLSGSSPSQVNLTAPAINLNGNVAIGGSLGVNGRSGVAGSANATFAGRITATDDVIGNGVSLDSHVHGGVRSGGDTTTGPQ